MRDGPIPPVLGTFVPVIANARSGGGHPDETLRDLRTAFAAQGIAAEVIAPGPGGLDAALAAAMKKRPPVIVAAGGDGTVSAVAHAVRGTATALAVLPFGTFNHSPGTSAFRSNATRPSARCSTGRSARSDVGEVNGRTFVNNASLGLYPGMVRTRDRLRRRFGTASAPRCCGRCWRRCAAHRLLTLELQADRDLQPCRSPFVFVGNNAYEMSGFDIGTRERLDGGRLSVYTTQRSSFAGLASLALRALVGRLHRRRISSPWMRGACASRRRTSACSSRPTARSTSWKRRSSCGSCRAR